MWYLIMYQKLVHGVPAISKSLLASVLQNKATMRDIVHNISIGKRIDVLQRV